MPQLEFKDKNGNPVNALSGKFYDHVNHFSIDLATNTGYDTSHNNQDSFYITIDNAINGSVATFRTYNLPINEVLTGDKSSGTIVVKQQPPNIIDLITGIAPDNEENLQSITNSYINTNIISHPFTSTDAVTAKLYVTIAGQKYSAICPPFLHNSTLPTLSNFSIKQNADSSKLEVTNLNVQNITSIKYYPEKVFILADILQKNGDLNTDYEVELGRTVVNNDNQYIANSSSMIPLDNNNNPITDNNVIIPLTQNKYEISTSSDASAGILYKQTNKDLIVYSISETKSNVILDYSSQSTSTLYLRAPVYISNVNPFDAIVNTGSSDSSSMSIMNVVIGLDWSVGYEPTSFVFKLTTINNNISPNAVWTFSTSTVTPILYRADGIYNITLNQMVYVGSSDASDTAIHPLDNNPSSYQLNVTANWEAINESRSTTRVEPVVFTQDFPTVLNVTAYNAWQPLSTFSPENIDSDDTVMPRSAFILKVLKNNLFNGNAPASLDDPLKTQFQIQYIRSSNLDSNSNGNWINVPSGYMTQPSDNFTGNSLLYNGALSALTGYNNSPNSQAGGLFNVPALAGYNIGKVGSQQNPLFVYLANIDGIYNESAGNPLLFRVKITSSVDGYDAPSSQFVSINNPIYAINKPLRYSFTTDSILEPSMDFSNTPNTLVIPMLVGGNDLNSSQSIYYSKGYVQWVRNSAITLPNISAAYGANPRFNVNLGTLVTYNVVYEYNNPNISGGYLSSKQSIDYSVKCQGLPAVSSDFTVSNDSTYYVYDNAPDADSLRFSLSMVNDSTSDTPNTNRIDGVDLYIKDNNNNVLNNGIYIARFYNYNASGIVKYTPGPQTVSLSSLNLTRGNSYNLEFKAFRDIRVESKGGVIYSSRIVDHYNPPPFIYLNTNVRDTPILYSWGHDDIPAQPYINFITDNVTSGHLVIPLDITQSPNYYGAYVNWYKNDYLGVDVASDANPVPQVSALQASNVNLPQFTVTYGTVVIYTVTYVYLSLDGTNKIPGYESTRRSLSAQGMPAIGDFTQSPAENPNAIPPAPVVQYIQDNTFNSLVFKLHTVDTLLPSTHRIDGVILFVTNDTGNQQYVATFSNADINLANGDFVVTNFTGSAYSLTPGNTYTLTFSAYRDRRVLNTDASYPSDNFKQSVNVISTVDFVFLANSIAPVFDDQPSGTNIISVEDPISHSSSGPADQYTINWPHSIINDVTQYLIYRVTPAIGSVPESSALENIVPAHFFPFSGIYSYQYDIPATSQKVTYDIQKSYNGRLSASTRISFPTGKLIPAPLTIVKQDNNNIMAELGDAAIELMDELALLDIMVKTGDSVLFPFTFNGGKKNTSGTQNVLTIPQLYALGQQLVLQQVYQIEWSVIVNGIISNTNLDTSFGDPATFVYASRPSISLYYADINDNMTEYQGKPALKLRLNAYMGGLTGNGAGFISPALTSLVVVLSQDTSTVVQNVKVDGVENLLMFNHADDLQPNSVYNAVSDFSNSSMKLLLNAYSNNVNTTFQLHTGNLTLEDASYLVFPDNGIGYVSNTGVDFMVIASNNYGIDSYVNSFVFVNKPTFTQNGVTVTGGSFVLQSTQDMSGLSFMPTYPTSNSPGVISYSSSNPSVATVNAVTGVITNVDTGSTDIILSQAASVNYLSSSIKATYSVLVPELFYYTDFNFGFDPALSVTLTPPSSPSQGAFTYTVIGNPDIVSIVGSSAVMRTAGTTTIRVTQAASSPYRSAYIDVPLSLTPIVSDWGYHGQSFTSSGIGSRVAISGDGSTYTIGSINNVYKSDPSKIFAQMDESQPNYGPIGHKRIGARVPGVGGSGYRVALSNDGNTIVYADPMSSLSGINAGNAWVYSYNSVNDTWTQKGGRINGFAREGFLGTSVSISYDGSIIAVSGGGGEWRTGVVTVFAYDQNKTVAQLDTSHPDFGPVNWTRLGGDIVGPNNNEMLGDVIKLSSDGSIIATSSYYSGSAKIFKRDPSAPNGWHQMGNTIVSNQNGGWFGYAMDTSNDGKTLIIGEHRNRGEVKIFNYNNTYNSWEPYGHIHDVSSGGWFGHSVTMSGDGNTISIGAPYSRDGSGGVEQTGKVSIYRRDPYKTVSQSNPDLANYDPDGWTKVGTDILSKEKFSEFGEGVSISGSGDVVMIGGSGILPRQGLVQLYKWGQVSTFGSFNINPELKVYKNQSITRLLVPPSSNANGSFSFISSDTNVAEITFNNNLWYLTVKTSGSSIITAVQAASPTFIRSTLSTELVVMAMYPLLGDFNLPSDLIYTPSSIVSRTLTPPTSNSQGQFTFTSSNLNVATIQLINGVYSINIVGSGKTKITAIQAVSDIYASASASHLLNTATGDISGFSIIDDSDFVGLASEFQDSNMTLQRSGDSGTGLIRRNENSYNPYVLYFNGTHNNYYVFTQDGSLLFDANGLYSSPDGDFDNGTISQVPIKKFCFFGCDLVSEVRSNSITNDTMILVKVSGYKYGDPSKTFVIRMIIDLRGGIKINYAISPSFNADKVNIGYVHTDTNSTNDDLFLTLEGVTFNDNYNNVYELLNGKTLAYNIDKSQFIKSGLLAHYDASNQQSLTISQFYATQLRDVSGNGHHLNVSTTPGPMMSRINNIPALFFGTGSYQSQTLVPMSENVTLFMVINYSSEINAWGSFIHHGFRDTNFNFRRNSVSATNFNLDFAVNANGLAELPMEPGRPYIIVGCINGNNVKFISYSLQDSTRTTNEYITTSPLIPGNKLLYVGKSDRGDYPELCNSTMGEILYYNVALPNDDINTNIKYLRNKWMSHTIPLYT